MIDESNQDYVIRKNELSCFAPTLINNTQNYNRIGYQHISNNEYTCWAYIQQKDTLQAYSGSCMITNNYLYFCGDHCTRDLTVETHGPIAYNI